MCFRAKQSKEYTSLAEKRQALQGKRTLKKTDKDFHKQFPCKKFKRGDCILGDTCKYNHPDNLQKAVTATTETENSSNAITTTMTEVTMET